MVVTGGNWANSIIRCPYFAPNATHANSSAHLIGKDEMLFVASDSVSQHIAEIYRASTELLLQDGNSSSGGSDSSTDGSGIYELIPYTSTTFLFGLLALESFILLALVVWRYHGLRLLTATAAGEAVRDRSVTPATNNNYWIAYFGSNAVGHLLSVLSLQVNAIARSGEGLRVLELLQRCCLGANCMALVLALGHQRLHRVKDHKRQKVSQVVKRQVWWINRIGVVLFVSFAIIDFIVSHVVDGASDTQVALYWVYIAVLVVLSIPLVISMLWVVLNKAVAQASRVAKCFLVCGVVVHLIVMLPPSLWNEHIFEAEVSSNPCPLAGGHMSAFDVVLVANIVSLFLFFVFVALEHRRNRLIGQSDYYSDVCKRLEDAAHNEIQKMNAEQADMQSKASELQSLLALN